MKAVTALPAMMLAACASVPAPPAATGTPTAALHQSANVESLLVTPLAVVEDSRCPADVQCVWAGRLIVRTEVRGGSWTRTLDLTMGEGQPVADGEITLVSASPEKDSRKAIQPGDYRFTYNFSGGY